MTLVEIKPQNSSDSELLKLAKRMIMTADDNLINEMYELYQKYDLDKNLSADEFKKFIKDKSKKPDEQNWLFSKYNINI